MTWQRQHAYCTTCGNVHVLCFAHDIDEAIRKIVAIINRYNLPSPTALARVA